MNSTTGNDQLYEDRRDNKQQPNSVQEERIARIPRRLQWAVTKNKQPTFLGHITLAASLLFFSIASYWVLLWFAGTREAAWLATISPTPVEVLQDKAEQLPATPAERSRLVEQFQEVEARAAKHAQIMGFFYKQYYISTSMIVGSAVMASICLFFISKSGWDRINNALINIFICSSAVILFHGNLVLVFKQDENLRGNQELYLHYISLRQEVLSYWVTQQTIDGKSLEPVKFIHYLDSQMQGLNKIQLGFDSPQISTFVDQFGHLGENSSIVQTSPQQ
ncbi:MAG TPA: hypothetical protein V6C65_36200 [Allocoleopsis sp.]